MWRGLPSALCGAEIVDALEDVDADVLRHMQAKRSSEHIAEHTVDDFIHLADEKKMCSSLKMSFMKKQVPSPSLRPRAQACNREIASGKKVCFDGLSIRL